MQVSGIQPFSEVYCKAVGGLRPKSWDIDVVESGSKFEPLIGLTVPASQRGKYGGNPPALNAQKWFCTLRIGIGVCNPSIGYPHRLSVGTVGFYVKDSQGNQYLVSNNHVIGRSNRAAPEESVVQPGTLDLTGNELEMMPTLHDLAAKLEVAKVAALVEINFSDPQNIPINRVDAALAKITKSDCALSELARLTYGGCVLGVADPYELDDDGAIRGSSKVYKVGRTTGYTEGEVTHIAGTATLSYDGDDAYFADQIIVQATSDNVGPFSEAGDSGSGILNDRHELVGLLFAGSKQQTLVNPIEWVMSQLNSALGENLTLITLNT